MMSQSAKNMDWTATGIHCRTRVYYITADIISAPPYDFTARESDRLCGVDFLVVNMTAEVMAAGRRRRRNTLGVFRGSDRTRPRSATDRPASQAALYIAWSDRRCVSV